MSLYKDDRAFTDDIHWRLAMPQIYKKMGWSSVLLRADDAKSRDLHLGIDYVFRNDVGQVYTVQERFREAKYQHYTDFTVRYRRDENPDPTRRASEYFKMQADCFTYGITNGYKAPLQSPDGFVKWAVVDLHVVRQKINDDLIEIRATNARTCFIEKDRLICPIQQNRDGSSSFFPIDIQLLVTLWGLEPLLAQEGFV